MNRLKLLFFSLLLAAFSQAVAGNAEEAIVRKLTKADFYEKVMNLEKSPETWKYSGNLPCIVDFYADWCGPCRKASPILEELALQYKGKIVVYKVNTDEEKELARAFKIQGIPAFLWVPKDGKPTMSSGIASSTEETKAMFEKMIKTVLLK
jgi:thioredoxin 1